MDVKGEINKIMEKLKKDGLIKSGLELDVSLSNAGMFHKGNRPLSIEDPTKKTTLTDIDGEDLADAFLCSNV